METDIDKLWKTPTVFSRAYFLPNQPSMKRIIQLHLLAEVIMMDIIVSQKVRLKEKSVRLWMCKKTCEEWGSPETPTNSSKEKPGLN